MSEVLRVQSVPSGSWSNTQTFGFAARTVILTNTGTAAALVRWAPSSPAVVRIAAGATRTLGYQNNTAPESFSAWGVGGTTTLYVEARQDDNSKGGGDTVAVTVTGAGATATNTPAMALGTVAAAGVAADVSRSDHVHPLPLGSTMGQALGAVGSPGVATDAARADHVHPRPTVASTMVARVVFMEPMESANASAVLAGFAGDGPDTFGGAIANPDVPRNLTVDFPTMWDGGDVTVTGTDQNDSPVSETFTAPGSLPGRVTGDLAFKTVTGATKTATGASSDAVVVGQGEKIGVAGLTLVTSVGLGFKALTAFSADVDGTAGTVDTSNGPPDALSSYHFVINVSHTHTLS